jgi:hypothetical protein
VGLNKEEAEEGAEKIDRTVAKIKFKDLVSRTQFVNRLENVKILELIVTTETGEPAFETMTEVRRLPREFKAAMLEAIKVQEGRSANLGE